jgi:Ca2+-binding RTX toxin-like protein
MTALGLNDTVTVDTTNGALTSYVLDSDIRSWNIGLTGAQNNSVTLGTTGQIVVFGAGNDTVTGGVGGDTITGGAGSDSILAGPGNDTIVFNSLTGSDTITGYLVANDSIELSKAVFTGLGVVGTLSADEFASGAFSVAQDATDRIIYNTGTGQLYYDVDGSGGTAAVLIGTFTGTPTVDVNEFSIIA